MKKLYGRGTVHPSPPIISDHLSFLPACLLTLTAALSPQDREVLAYLISTNNNNSSSSDFNNNTNHFLRKNSQKSSSLYAASGGGDADHGPMFSCDCFRCYKNYWVRWDTSPNRELIHDIIDAFEDELMKKNNSKGGKGKKDRRKMRGSEKATTLSDGKELLIRSTDESDPVREDQLKVEEVADGGGCGEEGEVEKGSMRRIVSFIGERIWGVWN